MTTPRMRPTHADDGTLRGEPGVRGLVQVVGVMGRLVAQRAGAWLGLALAGGIALTLAASWLLASLTRPRSSLPSVLVFGFLLAALQLGLATAVARTAARLPSASGRRRVVRFPWGVTLAAGALLVAGAVLGWTAAILLAEVLDNRGGGLRESPVRIIAALVFLFLVATAPAGLSGARWVGATTRSHLDGRDHGDPMPLRLARVVLAWLALGGFQVVGAALYRIGRRIPPASYVHWSFALLHTLTLLLLGLLLAAVWHVVEPDQDPEIGRVFE